MKSLSIWLPLLSLLLASCALTSKAGEPGYPAHWWTPVPKDSAPEWEVLPQEAGPGEVILSKRNELGILSNFSQTPFIFNGVRYSALEGFWQMMKFPEGPDDERAKFSGISWPWTREQVSQMTAFEAKKAGDLGTKNMKAMGINWVTYLGKKLPYRVPEKGAHYEVIAQAMEAKLDQNPEVKRILCLTGNLKLRPDHKQDADVSPAWRYHEIWMEFRGHRCR